MPFAFGHIVGTWSFGKLVEFFRDVKLNHLSWGLLLFGGILPDADLLLEWTFGLEVHRTFSHSFLFAFFIGILVYLVLELAKVKQAKQHGLAIAAGVFAHIFLDSLVHYGTPWFWPLPYYISVQGILLSPELGSLMARNLFELQSTIKIAIIDMAIGVAFLGYLWLRKKVKF